MTLAPEGGLRLDPNILENIADIICGDDTSDYYRTGNQISRLFSAAGWQWAGSVDGGRRAWVLDQLHDRRADPMALRRLILRLADPREYLDDDSARAATVRELNSLLALEGYELYYDSDGPRLRSRSRALERLNSQIPVTLEVDLSQIVKDRVFGAQLTERLNEARTCWDHGANLAAVIMLGSLLEGVLYDFACTHDKTWRAADDNLQRLIAHAGNRGWVSREIADYADVLRDHRNLIHPRKQHRGGHKPDTDVVRIAWNVVVAALNDLAVAGKREIDE
jgi:hypothetical protein